MKKLIDYTIRLTNGDIIKVDKMLHFSFSFIIAAMFQSYFIGMIAVAVIAILKELFDLYIVKTKFNTFDVIAGLLGGILYIIINNFKI